MPTRNATPLPALTTAQASLLADAALRPGGAIHLPAHVRARAGLKSAEALLRKGLVREIRATADLPVWRSDPDTGRAVALVLNKAGRNAAAALTTDQPKPQGSTATIGLEEGPATVMPTLGAEGPSLAVPAAAPLAGGPRPGSKLDAVAALLRRDRGASLDELVAATGWLPHTTRAALTGLRKRGYAVTRQVATDQSGSVYRLALGAAQPA